NMSGWNHFRIRDAVSEACQKPVAFVNDANAAAYGEFWVGTGAENDCLIMLTLGTGLGGGIIIRDISLDGEHSHGSECGHVIVDTSDAARMCPCGLRG
ncbi:MAG TPA: glucokinase, partial [Planctomycetaceae bacterium]|nr:glucokinase [Planctomycetaceae bacterium]